MNSSRSIKIRRTLVFIVMAAFFAIFALSFYTGQDSRSLFGSGTVAIRNNDLRPELKKGDIAIIRTASYDSLKVGDIIAYKSLSETMKVKVIDRENDSIKLSDGTNLKKDELIGKITGRVPLLGYVYILLEQEEFFIAVIILFAISILYDIFRNLKREREKRLSTKSENPKRRQRIFRKRTTKNTNYR